MNKGRHIKNKHFYLCMKNSYYTPGLKKLVERGKILPKWNFSTSQLYFCACTRVQTGKINRICLIITMMAKSELFY